MAYVNDCEGLRMVLRHCRFLFAGTESLFDPSDSLCHALLHPAVTCMHRSRPPRPSQQHRGGCSVAAGCGPPYRRCSDPPIPWTKNAQTTREGLVQQSCGIRLILKWEWEKLCNLCPV